MSDIEPARQILPYRRPVGYFEAKRAVKCLTRYYELIVMFYDFSDIDERKALYEKYPEYDQKNKKLLRQALVRLTVPAYLWLRRAGAPVEYIVQHTKPEYDFEKGRRVNRTSKVAVNIVLDRFEPNYYQQIDPFDDYQMITNRLENTIALYKPTADNFWKRLFNPVWIIAMLLRTPISILEYMGVNTESEQASKLLFWIIQGLFALVLASVALRLGVSGLVRF